MKKSLLLFIYIMFLMVITSFAAVTSVDSQDATVTSDNDENYNLTQTVKIKVFTDFDYLEGTIEIISIDVLKTTGEQALTRFSAGIYTYDWDTSVGGFIQANDYKVKITFSDATDESLIIKLDSSAPQCSSITMKNSLNNSNVVKNGDSVTVQAVITDSSYGSVNNISVDEIKADFSDFGGLSSVNPTSYDSGTGLTTWDSFIVSGMSGNGTVDISATKDKASNALGGTTTQLVTYDGTNPTWTTKSLTSPEGYVDFLKGSGVALIVADITDVNMDISDITADLSDFGYPSLVNPTEYDGSEATWEVNLIPSSEGVKTINITAVDNAGNTMLPILSHDVTVDFTEPVCGSVIIEDTSGNELSFVKSGQNIIVKANITETNIDTSTIFANISQLDEVGGVSVNPDRYSGGVAEWDITTNISSDGVKTFTVLNTSTDKAGNPMNQKGVSITADIIVPVVNSFKIVNSKGYENIVKQGETVDVVFELEDANGFNTGSIEIDISTLKSGVTSLNPTVSLVNTTGNVWAGTIENYIIEASLTEGLKTVSMTVNTVDKAGNAIGGAEDISVRVDNTSPAIATPTIYGSNDETGIIKATDTLYIIAKITEDYSDTSEILLDASSLGKASDIIPINYTNGDGATFEVSIADISASGTYELVITATDKAGNAVDVFTDSVEVDITAPYVSKIDITSDQGFSTTYTGTSDITVKAYISDIENNLSKADIVGDISAFTSLADTAEATSYSGGVATWTITSEDNSDGVKTFSLLTTVMDRAGNSIATDTLEASITEDDVAPELTSYLPIDNANIGAGTFEIVVIVDENAAIENEDVFITYTIDGGGDTVETMVLDTEEISYTYKKTFNTEDLGLSSTMTYYITCTDDAGNDLVGDGVLSPAGVAVGSLVTINVDAASPVFNNSVMRDLNDENEYVKPGDVIYLAADITDDETAPGDMVVWADISNLDSAFSPDTIEISYSGSPDTFEIELDPLSLGTMAEGTISVVIYAKDEVGNISNDTVEIILDKTAPLIGTKSITSKGGEDIYFKAGDTGEIIVNIGEEGLYCTAEISIMDSAFSDSLLDDDGLGVYSLDIAALTGGTMSEGTISVIISAMDVAGNESTDEVIAVLDNTAPSFTELKLADSDNWYKEGDTISFVAVFDTWETELTVAVDLSPLGGSFTDSTNEIFTYSYSDDTSSVYTYTSSALDSGINEIIPQALDITATDKAGNSTLDSTIEINTDITAPVISEFSSYKDKFLNTLITGETSYPVELTESYYNENDNSPSNINLATLEVIITDSNIPADMSTMNLLWTVPGKGTEEINIAQGVIDVDTDITINNVGDNYTVLFENIDFEIPGMTSGDSFEIYLYGTDSSENSINQQIMSATLKDYQVFEDTVETGITPLAMIPSALVYQTVTITGEVTVNAYNMGFDTLTVNIPNSHFNYIDTTSAVFKVGTVPTAMTLVNDAGSLGAGNAQIIPTAGTNEINAIDNTLTFYFPDDYINKTDAGENNIKYEISFDVKCLPLPQDAIARFTVDITNSTPLYTKRVETDSYKINLASPVSQLTCESYPAAIMPGGSVINSIFIKTTVGNDDSGFDRISVTNNLDGGNFEVGRNLTDIITNPDSIEVYVNNEKYVVNIDGDGVVDATNEVVITQELGSDIFTVGFYDVMTESSVITLKYKVTASANPGSFSVTLENVDENLSVTDSSGGNATDLYSDDDLDYDVRDIATGLNLTVSPNIRELDDDIEFEFTYDISMASTDSGVNRLELTIPDFIIADTDEISNLTVTSGGTLKETVVNKDIEDLTSSQVNMNIEQSGGDINIDLLLGQKLTGSFSNKTVIVKVKGKTGVVAGTLTANAAIGDTVNQGEKTDSVNIKSGNIIDGFSFVGITPNKIAGGKSDTFTLKVASNDVDGDFDTSSNLDYNKVYIHVPENIFLIEESTAQDVLDSIDVKKILSNGGAESDIPLTSIVNGSPLNNEALVAINGQTIEVTVGQTAHKYISTTYKDGTLEISFDVIARDTQEITDEFTVNVDNTLVEKKMLSDNTTVSGNMEVTLKETGVTATGILTDSNGNSPVYIQNSSQDNEFVYTSRVVLTDKGEPVNKIILDMPESFSDLTFVEGTIEVNGSGNSTVASASINTDNELEVTFTALSIGLNNNGTIEVKFTADGGNVNTYSTGENIKSYVDNSDFSLPVSVEESLSNSHKVYITDTADKLYAEVNPGYLEISTTDTLVINMRSETSAGQYGLDSFEIVLPEGLSTNGSVDIKKDGSTVSSSYYNVSTHEIILPADPDLIYDTREVINLTFDSSIKMVNQSTAQINIGVSSGNKLTGLYGTLDITASSSAFVFGSITATPSNVDSVTNNNNLNLRVTSSPAEIVSADLSVHQALVGEENISIIMDMDVNITNEVSTGIDSINVDVPTGFSVSDVGSVTVSINTVPVPGATKNISGNDIIIGFPTKYDVVGTSTVSIGFDVNTPSTSGEYYFSAVLANSQGGLTHTMSSTISQTNCNIHVQKNIASIIGSITPNNAVSGKQSVYTVFTRPVIESGDLSVDRFLINFPADFLYVPSGGINVFRNSGGVVDTIEVTSVITSANIPSYGVHTYDLAVTLNDTLEVSSTNYYYMNINLQAPALAADELERSGTFEVYVDNTISLSEVSVIPVNQANSSLVTDYPVDAGVSMNVRLSNTKIKDGSSVVKLTGAKNGNYRLDFSCEFSGLMDNSTIPTVKVRGNNSAEYTLNKQYFAFNKYSGYTNIPVSAIDDFTASVEVEFETTVKDIYGTQLSETTVSGLPVNPAFIIADFKAPISKDKMLILIRTSENIASGYKLYVEQENSFKRSVTVSKFSDNIYQAMYDVDLTKTGKAVISFEGTESSGILSGIGTKEFSVISGESSGVIAAAGKFTASFEKDFTNESGLIVSETDSTSDNEKNINGAPLKSPSNEEIEIMDGINMWPYMNFNRSVKLTYSEEIEHTGIFEVVDGKYRFAGNIKDDVSIKNSGSFVVAKDLKDPVISIDRNELILTDNGSGVGSVKVKVDGKDFTFNGVNSDKLSINLDTSVGFTSIREYDIEIIVEDGLLNKASQKINYVPTSLGNFKAVCYPNPAVSYVIFKADGVSLASKAIMKIYDVSGRLVFRQNVTGMSEIIWDLIDRRGNKVANGVYIYKFNVDGNESTGKLAVLK